MRTRRLTLIVLVLGVATTGPVFDSVATPTLGTTHGKLSRSYEANLGQVDARVKFLSRGTSHTLFLTPTEAVLSLVSGDPSSATSLRMRLVGSDPNTELTGSGKLPGKIHYLVGNDPARWRTDVSHYARVRYHAPYPGIDLVFHSNDQQLECDFVVAPGSDPGKIRLSFHGASGVEIDGQGDLVLATNGGRLRMRRPSIYQASAGSQTAVGGGYVLTGDGRVGFSVGAYDVTTPLVIDPVLVYSTYLGGEGPDQVSGIAVNDSGEVFVTGETFSAEFPTEAPLDDDLTGSSDVFVTKLNAAGNALVYSTYFGGRDEDRGNSIAIHEGNAYVTGETESADFPIENGIPTVLWGSEGFVTKLNASGSAMVHSTYLGGGGAVDLGSDIAVDSEGNSYTTGSTNSSDFPTLNAFQGSPGGAFDAFVTKLDPAGSIVYSTFLGGSGADGAMGIDVDSVGNAYVTGSTNSDNFPLENALQDSIDGLQHDAFVTKFNPDGTGLVYSTYLGSDGSELGYDVAADGPGNAYVVGVTNSRGFPTVNPIQADLIGDEDVFVTKVDPVGSSLVYSTFLGGQSFQPGMYEDESGEGIAVDPAGCAYVVGTTSTLDFPTEDPIQPGLIGQFEAFVTKLNAAGSALVFSSHLGGSDWDMGRDIAVTPAGQAHVAGFTASGNFPIVNALQPSPAGDGDGWIAKIAYELPQPVPDGITGTAMTASRLESEGNSVRIRWDVNTCASIDYHVLYGDLGQVGTLDPNGAACDPGPSGEYTWTGVPSGSLWFVVVGNNGAGTEGSWGMDSAGHHRGLAGASGMCGCLTQETSGTCPPTGSGTRH